MGLINYGNFKLMVDGIELKGFCQEDILLDSAKLLEESYASAMTWYMDEMLKQMKEDNMAQEFTKKDLKDGHIVTYRDGSERLVFKRQLFKIKGDILERSGGLEKSNENLTYNFMNGLDIIKVCHMGQILWERLIWVKIDAVTACQLLATRGAFSCKESETSEAISVDTCVGAMLKHSLGCHDEQELFQTKCGGDPWTTCWVSKKYVDALPSV